MVSASETRLGLGGGASMGRVESGVGSWGAEGGGMLVVGDILILKIFWYKQKLREVQKLAKTDGAFAIVVVSDLGGAPGLCRTRPGCDNNL